MEHDKIERTSSVPCDVGGCRYGGVYPFNGRWWVCRQHFRAYLQDEFDLDQYFALKERKMYEEGSAEAVEDALFDSFLEGLSN